MKKIGVRKSGGRNNQGRVTIRHRGGGSARMYRELEYSNIPVKGVLERIEYDPNRTGTVGVCKGYLGRKVYKLVGGEIGKEIKGVAVSKVEVGGSIYGVSVRKGEKGKIALAAGTKCKIIKNTGETVVMRMPSGKIGEIRGENMCYEGEVGVGGAVKGRLTKAGTRRRMGERPRVRGVAMNAVDHPLGGKTKSGQAITKWGKLAKWKRTRNKRKVGIIRGEKCL